MLMWITKKNIKLKVVYLPYINQIKFILKICTVIVQSRYKMWFKKFKESFGLKGFGRITKKKAAYAGRQSGILVMGLGILLPILQNGHAFSGFGVLLALATGVLLVGVALGAILGELIAIKCYKYFQPLRKRQGIHQKLLHKSGSASASRLLNQYHHKIKALPKIFGQINSYFVDVFKRIEADANFLKQGKDAIDFYQRRISGIKYAYSDFKFKISNHQLLGLARKASKGAMTYLREIFKIVELTVVRALLYDYKDRDSTAKPISTGGVFSTRLDLDLALY
jgi:hypothetical protein